MPLRIVKAEPFVHLIKDIEAPLHHDFWPLGHKTLRSGGGDAIEARFDFLIPGSSSVAE